MAVRGRPFKKKFDHAEARRLRGEGLTYREIGRRFGVCHTAIQKIAADVQMPPGAAEAHAAAGVARLRAENARRRAVLEARRLITRPLRAKGFTLKQIAEKTGWSVKVVWDDVHDMPRPANRYLSVEVPRWVPITLMDRYRRTALRHGEEVAASLCRRLKAEAASEARV